MRVPSAAALQQASLILVRHGQPQGVAAKSFLGHSDPALNASGHEQAVAVAEALAQLRDRGRCPPFGRLLSSDLCRAQETAAPIAARTDCVIEVDPRLREIDFGEWDGCTFYDIDQRCAGAATAWFSDPMASAPPAGETLAAVYARIGDFLADLLPATSAQSTQQSVIVVGHFGSLAMVAAWLLGLPPAAGLGVVLQRGHAGHIADGALRWWGIPLD